jgi:hypothetical protein
MKGGTDLASWAPKAEKGGSIKNLESTSGSQERSLESQAFFFYLEPGFFQDKLINKFSAQRCTHWGLLSKQRSGLKSRNRYITIPKTELATWRDTTSRIKTCMFYLSLRWDTDEPEESLLWQLYGYQNQDRGQHLFIWWLIAYLRIVFFHQSLA